jgi:hypothetical protein
MIGWTPDAAGRGRLFGPLTGRPSAGRASPAQHKDECRYEPHGIELC